MRRIETSNTRERGTAVVELAVVLPLLMLVSLMIMEGGAMMRTHIVLNNAAREAARASAMPENQGNTSGIAQVAVNYAALDGVTLNAAEVNVLQSDTVVGQNGVLMTASKVTISHPYTLNYTPKFGAVDGSLVLVGSAEFRNFY